ncbi:MAG: hypothetical protein AAF378_23515 [Cyanobacteria bacterium P01_A01_bin.84]
MKYKYKLNRLLSKKLISNFEILRLGLTNQVKTKINRGFKNSSNLQKPSSNIFFSKAFEIGTDAENLENIKIDVLQETILTLKNAALSIKTLESSVTSSEKEESFAQATFYLHKAKNDLLDMGIYSAQNSIKQIIEGINTVDIIYEQQHVNSYSNYLEEINQILFNIDSSIANFHQAIVTNISYDEFLSKLSNFSAKEVSF